MHSNIHRNKKIRIKKKCKQKIRTAQHESKKIKGKSNLALDARRGRLALVSKLWKQPQSPKLEWLLSPKLAAK